MSITNPVIATEDLTKEILQDLIREGLQDYADDASTPLTDPLSRGNKDAPLVLTSYPDQGLRYPHVVVEESNIGTSYFSNSRQLYANDVQIVVSVAARQDTERFQLKDSVRAFFVRKQADNTLPNGGLHDVEIGSTGSANWESDPEVTTWQATITGQVFTN